MLSAEGEGLEPDPDDTLVGPANGLLPLEPEPELELMLDCANGDVGDGRVVGMVS